MGLVMGLVMTCRCRAPSSHPRARVIAGGSAERTKGRSSKRRYGRVHASRTTQVLRPARSDRITDRRRGLAADCLTLCDREISIQGRTADARRHVHNTSARPLIEMMKPWLETELGRVPPAGPLAEAIRYALARWPALTRFLDDGRIELDNNPVERAIRPIALGRKNHLFAGSDGGGVRWAIVCSLIATAKLNNVEPFTWLRDVLQRMTDGHPASRLDELLPWNWQPISLKA